MHPMGAQVQQLLDGNRFADAEQIADRFLTVEEKALFQPRLQPTRGEVEVFRRVWKETH